MVDELTVDQVRKTCDPQSLGFETTGEIDPREGIIGQARALQALQFSLDIVDQGYNYTSPASPSPVRSTSRARCRPSAGPTKKSRASLKCAKPAASAANRA